MSIPRSELKLRTPPSMLLSTGSPSSKTALPRAPQESPPAENTTTTTTINLAAANRFTVQGNAIITGGAGDIGTSACHALLQHGLSGLAIFDLHEDTGHALVTNLQAQYPHATIIFIKVNVTDPVLVNDAMTRAEAALGPMQTVLCFAGIAFSAHALDITYDQWKTMFDVNTTGALLIAQAAAKRMLHHDLTGSIILMASISAHIVNFPQPQVHYNAAKAAVLSIKSSLAAEWARYGIRVNSISPGYMNTILNEGEGLAEHRAIWAQRTPFGRMGEPEELTGAIVLLASQAGSYMTGTDILVDGGITVF
jgi:sorbose reductase